MPKKLIEVALPLEAINIASAKERSIRHGHPSTLHLWWARRPLAACRAVLFASLVDDPSAHPEMFPTEGDQERERLRLFRIIEELVLWENSTNPTVLSAARDEIMKSTGGKPPPVLDPFCGGGSIPLEAQRLGLEAHGSDLNPIPVLINKALIEIPPKFAGRPPIHPGQSKSLLKQEWRGAAGLAEDVRYYGKWMRDEAEKRIGHLYPKVKLPKEHGGGEATVIAWLWARTVQCPNPGCRARIPLVKSFWLAKRKDRRVWVEPSVETNPNRIEFSIRSGDGEPVAGTISRKGGRCLACGSPVPFDHIRTEGKDGRIGARLMAIVADSPKGRIFLPPDETHSALVAGIKAEWEPEAEMAYNPFALRPPLYGLKTFGSIFTPRQLVALDTFCELVVQVREKIGADAGPDGANYATAVATYLALGVSRLTDICNALCMWKSDKSQAVHLFTRQAIPMLWDFPEPNVFGNAAGDFGVSLDTLSRVLERLPSSPPGFAQNLNATDRRIAPDQALISTDPPYYNNIDYADLSDFFYVWLRRCLSDLYPSLFATLLTPKAPELVATPYRFEGSKEKAKKHFLTGLSKAFERMHAIQQPDFPLTVYYAFKQTESEEVADEDESIADDESIASTGWETMLAGLVEAGFSITGTWPMRTEASNKPMAFGMNALTTSIVIVCRPRPANAPKSDRARFAAELKRDLPAALKKLQHGNIAPVDLAQASIGPGMAIFSKYEVVREASGRPMTVRTALQLINKTLDEVLTEQEGEYDPHTRWAVAWFESQGMDEGPYGTAELLSKAKACGLDKLQHAGVLTTGGGKVKLVPRQAMPDDLPPNPQDMTVWEVTQRLIRSLLGNGGEAEAARLLARVGYLGEVARDLAYRLYTTCERKRWAQEALAYNSLVIAWPQLTRLTQSGGGGGGKGGQPSLPGAE